jgi:lambda family phage tail tape measure protein
MAAATTTLKVNVDTTDATRSLAALNSKFNDLKTAILGAGFATAITQANNYANAIKDVSVASDISIASVVALGKAFSYNGGTAEGAQNAVLKFSQSLGDAINGSDSAQKAFAAAGISLDDIFNRSQQENLNQYLINLGRMENTALRTRNQIEILGRSSKGVDFGGGVQGTMAGSPVSAADIAAINAGAAASENMKRQFDQLIQALLNVTKPLNDIVASINITAKAFQSLINLLVFAGSAFLIFGKILPAVVAGQNALIVALKNGGGALTLLKNAFMGVIAGPKAFVLNIMRAVGVLESGLPVVASLVAAFGGLLKGLLRFAGIAGIFIAIAQGIDFVAQAVFKLNSPIDYVTKKFKEFFNIGQDRSQVADDGTTDMINDQIKALEAAKIANEEARKRREKMAVEIRKVGDAYAYSNDKQLESIANETRFIGKTEDEIQVLRGLADIFSKANDEIKSLKETRAKMAGGTEEEKRNIDLIDIEIKRINKLTEAHAQNFLEYTNRLQGARILEEDRIRQVENLTRAIEQQTVRTQALGQAQLSIIDKSRDVDFARIVAGLTPLQARIAQIQEDARKAALEAGRAYAGAFEDSGDGLTPERAEELTRGLESIAAGYKSIADQQIENLQQSRTFADGWRTAFEEYADAAYNASEIARSQFTTATKGMEDAIVNFAKTGKFEFKGFLSSIVEELLRSNIRQLLTQAFGGVGSGGGSGNILSTLFSAGKSLLGFANGGMIPTNGPVLVGERGPEILTGAGGRGVIPNEALGGSTNITYNINAVDASSFRSLVASDPEFMFAVTEQGRRRMPNSRR